MDAYRRAAEAVAKLNDAERAYSANPTTENAEKWSDAYRAWQAAFKASMEA